MFQEKSDAEIDAELLEQLRDPLVWEAEPWIAIAAAAFDERLESEDETAAVLCEEIFVGPPQWWPQRLRRTDGAETAGMVRAILQRARTLSESRPPDALQATLMAEAVAEALEPEAYPRTVVERLRSQALREQATVLRFMGRFGECLEVAERSKRLIEWLPCAEWDLARLAQVTASALQNLNRTEEAVELAREAGETFLKFGDRSRYVGARMIEAAALYEDRVAAVEVRPYPRSTTARVSCTSARDAARHQHRERIAAARGRRRPPVRARSRLRAAQERIHARHHRAGDDEVYIHAGDRMEV